MTDVAPKIRDTQSLSDMRMPLALSVVGFVAAALGCILTSTFLEIPSMVYWVIFCTVMLSGFAVAFALARSGWASPSFAALITFAIGSNTLYPFVVPEAANVAVFCFSCTIIFLTGLAPAHTWWRFPLLLGAPAALLSVVAAGLHPAIDRVEWVFVVVHGVVGVVLATLVARSRHTLRRRNQATQTQLFATDRMASLGVIAAGLGHEINNPLAYIQLNLKAVLSSDKVDLEDRDALVDAMEGAKRIEQVVKNLGFFARPEQKTVVLEVKQILESTIDLVRPQFRHQGTIETNIDGLIYIEDANGRLGQVALNLITNAIQATRNREGATIVVGTRVEGETVEISVDDNGPGIPAQLHSRVFDSFFTTKGVGEGTGLGLSICQHLVEDAGGVIDVEDSDMGGARFVVKLPRAYPKGDVFVKKRASKFAHRPRVLIIDDDQRVAAAMGRALRTADVTVVASGEAGLAKMDREDFDVVFCDVMMPGLSGLDVYNTALERDAALAEQIVFVTGGAYAGVSHEDLAATGRTLLKKPVKADVLRQAVFEAVSKRKQADPLHDVPLKRSA